MPAGLMEGTFIHPNFFDKGIICIGHTINLALDTRNLFLEVNSGYSFIFGSDMRQILLQNATAIFLKN